MSERELFIAALEIEPPERTEWLRRACAGDAALQERVEILLRAHEQASRFLAAPAMRQFNSEAFTAKMPTATATSFDDRDPADSDLPVGFLSHPRKPGQLGQLGDYEVLEVVGRGGMSIVLKAFEPKLHRLVAIKVMAGHLAASAAARRRFEREAKAVAAVRNEHVVAIHAVEPDGPTPYLVMEFIGGVSLQERLERRGPMELKEILRIGRQAALGLAAAHAQGLVHRDIKPANILLENGVERVKLTDFGLARAADDASITQSGTITGTPNYMSPEQADGKPVDHRSDLFSLGSVVYAMATGHPPFRASGLASVLKRVAADSPRSIREINPDMPDWLDAIIQKLHAKDPANRFQSAREVADLLGQHLAHLQQPKHVSMPAKVAPPPATGRRVWKQIFDATDHKTRILQHGLAILAILVLVLMLTSRHPVWANPLAAGMASLAIVSVCGCVKQRWRVPYKGRTLRFENSIFFGEKLFLDRVLIARGGFGVLRELLGQIPPGPGEGDIIRALANARLFSFRCRIEASDAWPTAPAADKTASAARPVGAAAFLLAFFLLGPIALAALFIAGEPFIREALDRAERFIPGALFFLAGLAVCMPMAIVHVMSMRKLKSALPAAEFAARRRRSRIVTFVIGFLLSAPFFVIGWAICRHNR